MKYILRFTIAVIILLSGMTHPAEAAVIQT